MKRAIIFQLFFLMAFPGAALAITQTPRCAAAVLDAASKLLAGHSKAGTDANPHEFYVEPNLIALPSVRNPAKKSERLDVVEVWGSVYRATFRMRFLLIPKIPDCVIFGQEIIDWGPYN